MHSFLKCSMSAWVQTLTLLDFTGFFAHVPGNGLQSLIMTVSRSSVQRNSKFEPQSWSSCLKPWFHDVSSSHGCQGSGLCFSKVRLLPTSPWPPLWGLGEPPSPQDPGEVKPNEVWEKTGSSLTFFPRGLGYDLEKRCPREVEHPSCRGVAEPRAHWLGPVPTLQR